MELMRIELDILKLWKNYILISNKVWYSKRKTARKYPKIVPVVRFSIHSYKFIL